MIDLVPSSSLMESKTDFVSPSLSLILSQFGGALGLWLGLGVTQLVQVQYSSMMSILSRLVTGSDCTTKHVPLLRVLELKNLNQKDED